MYSLQQKWRQYPSSSKMEEGNSVRCVGTCLQSSSNTHEKCHCNAI